MGLRLNLGCGNKRKEGHLGVDLYPCEALEVRADITGTLPFADNSVDGVWMDNVIEHILDVPALMKELVRVCRDGAEITMITPHFSSIASWADPTHVHHFAYVSFEHFEQPGVAHYIGGGLKIVHRKLSFVGGPLGLIGKLIFKLTPWHYESQWCYMFRASTLTIALRVVK
jgi:SAM-dependent methyltransferase